jgi:hypothetical protein
MDALTTTGPADTELHRRRRLQASAPDGFKDATAYAISGKAPGHVTTPGAGAISNVVRVPFTISP